MKRALDLPAWVKPLADQPECLQGDFIRNLKVGSAYSTYWNHDCILCILSCSLGFPKPAGPRPETRLAGYKPKGVIHSLRLSPSNVATMLLRLMSPPRRLKARQWELFVFFARPARSALLISGRRRTLISRSPIISTFSTSPARDPMLYGCTIYTVPHQRFQLSSLCIFAARISLRGSWHWFLAFVPSHVGHPPSCPPPSIHILDCRSWCS